MQTSWQLPAGIHARFCYMLQLEWSSLLNDNEVRIRSDSLCICACLRQSLYVCLSISGSLPVYACLCLFLPACFCLYLSLPICAILCLFLHVSGCLYLSYGQSGSGHTPTGTCRRWLTLFTSSDDVNYWQSVVTF